MQKSAFNKSIAVVGATGMVGRTILSILNEKNIQISCISAVASKKSAGQKIAYGNDFLTVHDLESFLFKGIDYALFSPGSSVSAIYAPKAASEGALVIDNTSYFRNEADVPLVIPEVNGEVLKNHPPRGIIANPNCVLMQLAVALKPLHDQLHLTRVSISAYQSVCGAGKEAVDELLDHTKAFLETKTHQSPKFFKSSMAFNVLAEIGDLMDNGFTSEEWKIRLELQKVLGLNIPVSATCVRVPVVTGHSISAHVHFKKSVNLLDVKELLNNAPGVVVKDQTVTAHDVDKTDPVYISRLRIDPDDAHGLLLWICADNLRKGAALNAIQIMEYMEDHQFVESPKKVKV